MKVGWNYAWRFGVAAVLGAGAAALLAVGITTGSTGLIVGGVGLIGLLGVFFITVLMPWTRAWSSTLPK
jgi:hypothetical protein